MEANKKKAIALYSGGLDSILAIRLILEQGIEVTGVYFKTPFLNEQPDYRGEKYLNISLIYEDLSKDYKEILFNPKYGFGKNRNPCIDCRIMMFKKAGLLMLREDASFIISGEVLGQRPMSQSKKNLLLISEESGFGKYILRPLSALLLPETEPERCHIVNRTGLLDIQGRSRKRQMALAQQWGIGQYPSPAGGCKLTEPGFAKRIKDLLSKGKYNSNDLELLKSGRHFNIDKNVKLVVGRNEKENKILLSFARQEDYLFSSPTHKGPVALLRFYNNLIGKKDREVEEILDLASRITARYCDKEDCSDLIDINIWQNNKIIRSMEKVFPFPEQSIKEYLI
jgi:tRNA-specific 2-thiouridylase